MSRAPRIVVPGLPHHVVLRGNNRRRLFSYPSDRLRFIAYLRRAQESSGSMIHAIDLMQNHVHLVPTPSTTTGLADLIKPAAERYAAWRNRIREGSGKLFEERFYSHPIVTTDQLMVTTLYAELNAARAGLVADPLDDEWSTYAHHVGRPERSRIPAALWQPSAWYLALGATAEVRAARYAELASEYLKRVRPPDKPSRAELIEARATRRYTRRLLRPDGSFAGETRARYCDRSKNASGVVDLRGYRLSPIS
jgi:putative transposase